MSEEEYKTQMKAFLDAEEYLRKQERKVDIFFYAFLVPVMLITLASLAYRAFFA